MIIKPRQVQGLASLACILQNVIAQSLEFRIDNVFNLIDEHGQITHSKQIRLWYFARRFRWRFANILLTRRIRNLWLRQRKFHVSLPYGLYLLRKEVHQLQDVFILASTSFELFNTVKISIMNQSYEIKSSSKYIINNTLNPVAEITFRPIYHIYFSQYEPSPFNWSKSNCTYDSLICSVFYFILNSLSNKQSNI